jgi:ANTAR domain
LWNAGREPIHYICGILMLIYRIDPGAAFEALKWRSQETNVKLRKIA